ncbi:MAG: YkgJ family cysteine cluster protein [Cyanobacteria bacterium RUI128]|nr:YkgJ family cysteine cluster protein [Cyanobacteria bacterium RUI128]
MHNLENYEILLDFITPAINKKFENQKEYLACAKGCSLCCKTVSMPYSEIEFEYIKQGFNSLNSEEQKEITDKIKNITENKNETACPFLKDDICSVYKYRGLICRTFGLLFINENGEHTVPFCVHNGLNYAKIFDEKTQKLSVEKYKEQGFSNEPTFHTLTREQIFNLTITKDLGITPGESKPLSEWLKTL